MASGSSFMGFGGSFIDAVAADWDMELRLLHNPDFLTSEGEPLSDDIFGPPLPSWDRLLSTTEPLPASPLEIPPATQYAPVVTQDVFLSPQIPHEAPVLRSCTTATPPRDLLPTTSNSEVVGTELPFTGPTQPSAGALPILSPPAPSSSPVTVPPLNWIRVPQRDYNHGRRQRNFERTDPISFNVDGHPGINMGDALRKMFTGLDGRDDPVLRDAGGAISCRFLFPGYPANSSSCQIHVLDWTKNRLPITRSKLAREVAKKLERYLNDMTKLVLDGSAEDRWRVGEGLMRIENMFLVRLVSVSKGSFQPEIWVADSLLPRTLSG